MTTEPAAKTRANKADTGTGSDSICLVIDTFRSP